MEVLQAQDAQIKSDIAAQQALLAELESVMRELSGSLTNAERSKLSWQRDARLSAIAALNADLEHNRSLVAQSEDTESAHCLDHLRTLWGVEPATTLFTPTQMARIKEICVNTELSAAAKKTLLSLRL